MFTGLIEVTGVVARMESSSGGLRLEIATPLAADLHPGDSIAANGVCLTVTGADRDAFSVDVSPQTLRVTSLKTLAPGRAVNLERPLRADARLGGHFVLGHVDDVGRVADVRADGDAHWIDIDVSPAFAPLLIPKGSVAVDGISLTVAALSARRFGVQIVPFTWAHTNLRHLHPGETVNLEGDVLGKYVLRLLESRTLTETT